ncbi:hypothetical protein CJ010_10015 [Azoarcus sp. DD4]|uniref:hypothetical protein n=1 Tax=Azoarcus sp. DD4 TaxID=2027405 RepID=UPI001128A1F9|nr:hypothetical protein [Azoarcus sp. DD4]QDF96841.1 hypothetical protein CJ010_10015 [Azoarcus sp. DD4]
MAMIVIRDLPESLELDHEAMLAIVGGARTHGRQPFASRLLSHGHLLRNAAAIKPSQLYCPRKRLVDAPVPR